MTGKHGRFGAFGLLLVAATILAAPGGMASASAGMSTSEKAALTRWANANEPVVAKLTPAFQAATLALGRGKAPALHKDCSQLEVLIARSRHLPPVPDPAVQAVLKRSLGELMAGTKACSSATSGGKVRQSLLRQAGSHWATGGKELVKVGHELKAAES